MLILVCGRVVNFCWESPSFERRDKFVGFKRLE
jgi:hypothetical protein